MIDRRSQRLIYLPECANIPEAKKGGEPLALRAFSMRLPPAASWPVETAMSPSSMAKETSVPQAWIAERLNLKSAANANQQIPRLALAPEQELPKEVRVWKLSRNVA